MTKDKYKPFLAPSYKKQFCKYLEFCTIFADLSLVLLFLINMMSINFNQLSVDGDYESAWQALFLQTYPTLLQISQDHPNWLFDASQQWHTITQANADDDKALTDWLMVNFAKLFAHHHTILVRGGDEPEYFPASPSPNSPKPAQIVFAHGYFSSSLHEISHWCIAGKKRRQLQDFGYWYTQDGRTQSQQQAFEQVEIKPQAIECLFTLACRRYFYVSQDNLNASFDTHDSTFAYDVFLQAQTYLNQPTQLPKDAKILLSFLLAVVWRLQYPNQLT